MMKRCLTHNVKYRCQRPFEEHLFTAYVYAESRIQEPDKGDFSTGVFLSLEDDRGLGTDNKALIPGGNIRRPAGLSP